MTPHCDSIRRRTFESDTKLPWPKHFFDALMRSDWRKWMEATKKEMAGWDDNDAYELVDTASSRLSK